MFFLKPAIKLFGNKQISISLPPYYFHNFILSNETNFSVWSIPADFDGRNSESGRGNVVAGFG